MQPQDPMNTPSAIATRGAEGKDVVGEDFAEARAAYRPTSRPREAIRSTATRKALT
jgi:hypothetical protein